MMCIEKYSNLLVWIRIHNFLASFANLQFGVYVFCHFVAFGTLGSLCHLSSLGPIRWVADIGCTNTKKQPAIRTSRTSNDFT